MKTRNAMPLGIRLVLAFHLVNVVLWTVGQGGAVLAYDTVASWGLQDPRALIDPAIVEVNRGIGLADLLTMIPIFVVAIVGLWRMKKWGAVASWLALGITFYWPVIYWCCQLFFGRGGIRHVPTPMSTNMILAAVLVCAAWATWYLARHYEDLGPRPSRIEAGTVNGVREETG